MSFDASMVGRGNREGARLFREWFEGFAYEAQPPEKKKHLRLSA